MTKDQLRVGLDLDDTLAVWYAQYLARFGQPQDDYEVTKNVQRILKYDREFWLNLPVKHMPNFQPTLYCTARVNKKAWSKQYLKDNGFPEAPVYQVYGHRVPKSPIIKGRVDVFIDDSIFNFEDLNKNGICCLLMDSEYNRSYETPFRIHSLDLDEIFQTYQAMTTWI